MTTWIIAVIIDNKNGASLSAFYEPYIFILAHFYEGRDSGSKYCITYSSSGSQ